MMRKFSIVIVILGFALVDFAYLLPVNKYGMEGALDCDGPLKATLLLCMGLALSLVGLLIFFLKPFWDWKSNKIFYSVLLLTAIVVGMKIPEIYHESQVNEEHCH